MDKKKFAESVKEETPKIHNLMMEDARFKSLEDLLEKTVREIKAAKDTRELNPLYAHIKIAQILNDIIPMLKHLHHRD